MHLEFSESEMVVLKDLLDRELNDIAFEIHHTFISEYKEYLKERKQHIHDMCEKVDHYVYSAETPAHDTWATMT